MREMNGVDEKREKETGRKRLLILKWGNHKHRITINHGHPGSPASKPLLAEEGPSTVAASALPRNLRARNRTVAPEMEENKKKVMVEEKRNLIRSKMAKKNEPTLKLAVPLSESEIMDDFLKMTGKKPPSRPKKRARAVQRDVEYATYLGLSLVEIPCNRYDVSESPPCTKKVKGTSGDK